jgi:NADPH:quinone reductase-like Zn-dependent oxidoreductase
MKAIVRETYGPPERLESRDIPLPQPSEAEVVVHIRNASVNVGDTFAVRGSPLPMRVATGFLRPRQPVPGFDLAGEVASVGPGVTRFRPGDAVFGVGNGTFADYATAAETTLAQKPPDVSFEAAAAIPTAGLAALQGLRDAGRLQPGQEVLVIGASGGVGTFAVQIAAKMGARVTAVCGTANVELVRSLGAAEMIDYTRRDFAADGPRFDLILDNVERRSLADTRRALKPSGTLVLNSGTGSDGLSIYLRLVRPLVLAPFSRQGLRRYLSHPNPADLELLGSWVENGAVKPVIDSRLPLAEAASALRRVESHHARGKVVLVM